MNRFPSLISFARLLFLSNVPGAMFIQGGVSIPDSRAATLIVSIFCACFYNSTILIKYAYYYSLINGVLGLKTPFCIRVVFLQNSIKTTCRSQKNLPNHFLERSDFRVEGRSQTTLTFSMVWTLTKSGHFWTTYLPT